MSPPDFPLWLAVASLERGATLRWDDAHGDEAIYVLDGGLEVDGRHCPAAGSIVVEANVDPVLRASDASTVVHVGPYDPTPPVAIDTSVTRPDGGVHVVGPRGTYAAVTDGRDTHYYADSTCPTCRLTLLYTSRASQWVSPAHSHSQDEIIHVVSGEISLGSHRVGPGASLAIVADRRYAFRSESGFAFLNYRRDASWMSVERGGPPLEEGGLVNGLVPVLDVR